MAKNYFSGVILMASWLKNVCTQRFAPKFNCKWSVAVYWIELYNIIYIRFQCGRACLGHQNNDICHKLLFWLFDEVLLSPIAPNDHTDEVIKFVGTKNRLGTWVRHNYRKTLILAIFQQFFLNILSQAIRSSNETHF